MPLSNLTYAGEKATGYSPEMEGLMSFLTDKKPRFEISDQGAKLNSKNFKYS
jgi:hypothetical protein